MTRQCRASFAALLTALLLVAAAPTQQGDGFDEAMARGAAALQAGEFDAAQSAFAAALAVRPGHPAAQAFLGNALLASGDVARATELLEESAREANDYYPARLGLGRAYLAAGRTSEAIGELHAAARIDPTDRASRALLAQALMQTGRTVEARAAAHELVQIAPGEFSAHYLLATAELQAENPGNALPAFDAALQIRPDDASATYGRALALRALARVPEARVALGALLEAHSDYADAWLLMGEIAAAEASSFDGILLAAEFYHEGLQLRPGDPRHTIAFANLYLRLGLFNNGRELLAGLTGTAGEAPQVHILRGRLAAGDRDYEAAAEAHRRAINAGGGAEAWYWLGVARFNLADPSAAESFAQATRLEPAYGSAWRELGKVHLDANRPSHARAALDQAVALLPDDAEAHYLRGMVLTREGEIAAAVVDLELALSLDPRHAEAKYNLALALRRTGEVERSQALLAQAQETRRAAERGAGAERQQRGQLILRQGYARYRLGQPEQALQLLDQAATLVEDNDILQLYRGLALAELNRPEEALASLQAAADLNQDRPDTWQALALLYSRLGRTEDAQRAQAKLDGLVQNSR
jgi:tetratricopeptide (TPR) repeat protein